MSDNKTKTQGVTALSFLFCLLRTQEMDPEGHLYNNYNHLYLKVNFRCIWISIKTRRHLRRRVLRKAVIDQSCRTAVSSVSVADGCSWAGFSFLTPDTRVDFSFCAGSLQIASRKANSSNETIHRATNHSLTCSDKLGFFMSGLL